MVETFSKVATAKLMKAVGSYEEAELVEVVDNAESDKIHQYMTY